MEVPQNGWFKFILENPIKLDPILGHPHIINS